jgi:hypothetical protein
MRKIFCRPSMEEWLLIINELNSHTELNWRRFTEDGEGYCYVYDNTVYFSKSVFTGFETLEEVSVGEYIDHIRDSITTNRLKKKGFKEICDHHFITYLDDHTSIEVLFTDEVCVNMVCLRTGRFFEFPGIKTYTELMTFLKFKTKPVV